MIKSFDEANKEYLKKRIDKLLNLEELSKEQKIVLNDYNRYLTINSAPLTTIYKYLHRVKKLGLDLNKNYKDITKKPLENYFVKLTDSLKPRTLENYKIDVITFFKWFYREYNGWKPKDNKELPDIVRDIKPKRVNTIKEPDDILTIKEIEKLIQVCNHPRDKAMLFVLYESGLRKSAFLRLKIKNITFDRSGVLLTKPEGKTKVRMKKLRLIDSVPDLKAWLEIHPEKNNLEANLWVNRHSYLDKPMSINSLNNLLKHYGKRTKIPIKKCFVHNFRHARATELCKQGFNESELRLIFDWSPTSDMPSVYLHMSGGDINKKLAGENGHKEEIIKLTPITCARCNHINSATLNYCEKCYMALDLKTVIQEEKKKETKYDMITEFMKFLIQKNPNLMLEFMESKK